MALSVEGLRALTAIAEHGSLSAAAVGLGYTQSAVTRQLAALERQAADRLVERGNRGARLTDAGLALLPHAQQVLESLAAAQRVAEGRADAPPLRLGIFTGGGTALLPTTLGLMRSEVDVPTLRVRESATPSLVRGVRNGSLDAALVISRTPFRRHSDGSPALRERVVGTMALGVAVAAASELGQGAGIHVVELTDCSWVASPAAGSDPTMGVWPSLPAPGRVQFRTTDWLTKLTLVGAGLAVTTAPPILDLTAHPGVRLLPVLDPPPELRRITLISRSRADHPMLHHLEHAATTAFDELMATSATD